jgi:hypothetical protein
MLQIVSITSFVIVLALLIYRYRRSFREFRSSFFWRDWLNFVGIEIENLKEDPRRWLSFLIRVSFIALAITGFIPVIFGATVSGFGLILHVIAAAIFAVCLAIMALLLAHPRRFNEKDWQSLQHFIEKRNVTKKSRPQFMALADKITFWLILLLALPVILSVALSMYTFFGTDAQEVLLLVHGYTALLLLLIVIMRVYILKMGDE